MHESLRHLLRPILSMAILVGGFGCVSTGMIEPMDVTLVNVEISEVTVFETTLVASLRISNPNPEPFTIDGASFKLFLEEKKIGTGNAKDSFEVDRLDSHIINVLFHINNASALLRIRDILDDDNVSYGIRGSLFTQGTFGTKRLKVEKSGKIDLGEMNPSKSQKPLSISTPP